MEFRILGPLSLADGEVERELSAGRQRNLLALLTVFAGEDLSPDRIIESLWADAVPAHPQNALQQQVSGLRRLLSGHGASGLLVTTGQGYRLDAPEHSIDARRFERLVRHGHDAVAEGRYPDGVQIIEAGLSLWRGPPLAGVDGEWAAREADRLREMRTAAIEDRVEADLAFGRHSLLVPELTAMVADNPLRERLRGQLMVALAACGRQGEALQAYETGRVILGEELGIDPSPDLQRVYSDVLHQRIPSATPSIRGAVVSSAASGASSGQTESTLQQPTAATLFGRDEAELELAALLGSERLISIVGVGGCGKTRLASEAAERYARQEPGATVHVARLSALADGGAVADCVREALGVATGRASGGSPLDAVANAVGGRSIVIVLDGCEHVLASARLVAERIRGACPNASVLATSREPLDVPGEVIRRISGLSVPPEDVTEPEEALRFSAVALFCQRVTERVGGYRLEREDCSAAVRITRRLDGLPLPIELAAGLVPVLSVREVADSLHRSFAVLSGRSRRTAEERHRTFAAALDWSWQLLDEADRTAWMALSAFAGSFSRDDAGGLLAAAGEDMAPLDAVTALVHRSLLATSTEGGTTRYRMLESIREYGRVKLRESGRSQRILMAHARLVEAELVSTDRCTVSHWSVDVEGQRDRVDEARAALRVLLDAGEQRSAQRVAAALGWFWYLEGSASEGLRWLDEALGPIEALPDAVEPAAVLWQAGLRTRHPSGGSGQTWALVAIDAANDASDPVCHALAQVFSQTHRALAGDPAAALETVREQGGQGWLRGTWRLLEAQLLAASGSFDEAEPALLEAEELLISNGAWWGITASSSLVQLAQSRGDAAAAERAGLHALQHTSVGAALHVRVQLRCLLAMIEQELGKATGADEHLRRAEAAAASGPTAPRSLVESARGYILGRRGDAVGARAAYQDCLRLHDAEGHPLARPLAFWGLGHLALAAGDLDEATRLHGEGLEAAHDSGIGEAVSRALEGLATAAAARGFPAIAARFLGAAHSARRPFEAWPVIGAAEARRVADKVRASLGAPHWDTAFRAGMELDREQLEGLLRRLGGTSAQP